MLHFSHIFVTFAVVMEQLKEKYEQFKEWQVKPHEVAQLTADKHVCATCHTEFHGNYCPRCGQKSTIGRYSFKTAFLTFLDVWGLGNRGMFRTIRDLLFRPGYMIRDYLSGMQMAYFPPFKMFFLLIALSVIVDSGFNVKMQNNIRIAKNRTEDVSHGFFDALSDNEDQDSIAKKGTVMIGDKPMTIEAKDKKTININGKDLSIKGIDTTKRIFDWIMDNQTLVQFLWLLVLSAPLYLFFRHNPKIPDVRYSEFFVSMIYITNMMTIITIIGGFFIPGKESIELLAYMLSIIPLKQLYGYSYKKTFFKVAGAVVLLSIIGIILVTLIGFLIAFFVGAFN